MASLLRETALPIRGVYEPEHDGDIDFQWFAEDVSLSVDSSMNSDTGIFFLQGESPVDGNVKVTTPLGEYHYLLKANRSVRLPIVLREPNGGIPQEVFLHFSNRLIAAGESRELCFKLTGASYAGSAKQKADVNFSPAYGKGIPKGYVATTFNHGWLRMAVAREKHNLYISGILLPPLQGLEYPVLCANGKPLQNIKYQLNNIDYPMFPNCAFEGSLSLKAYPDTAIRFNAAYASNGHRANQWYHDWVWPRTTDLPMPGSEHMRRIGAHSDDWFLFSGATFIANIERCLDRFFPEKSLPDCSILDWGCGCGRCLRHLVQRGCRHLVGCDIDPLNLDWCARHIPDVKFSLVSPDPPMDFPDKSFDVIYAHSVLTHLSEADQFLWLAELQRLLKDDGIAIVTIMGNYSAAIENTCPNNLLKLMDKGFLDMGWQRDGVDSQRPGYYRRIFHTTDYILKNWQGFFHIEAVLEGFSDHQAAIVVKKYKI